MPEVNVEVKPPALNPRVVKLGEHVRAVHVVQVPAKVRLEDVMDPDFWAHCGWLFKTGDKVECRTIDNAWYADLMVASVGPLLVKMWLLHYVELGAPASASSRTAGEFAATWGGPVQRWRVVRLSDKAAIHVGEDTREAAEQWIEDFVAGKVSAG